MKDKVKLMVIKLLVVEFGQLNQDFMKALKNFRHWNEKNCL